MSRNEETLSSSMSEKPGSSSPSSISRSTLEIPPLPRDSSEDSVSVQSTYSESLLPNRDGFSDPKSSVVDIIKEGRRVIVEFLKEHRCYELIKNSGKVVVFDTRIPINLAFFALVEHDIKSAPLWNAEERRFVGMITATDFVNILRHLYLKGAPITEMGEHSISSWKATPESISMTRFHDEMVSISPESSLYHACKMLQEHRLHRIPIVDKKQDSALAIVTHSGILEYLVTNFREQRRLYDQSIKQLGIGTFTNLVTVPVDTPLVQVLHTLIERRISAVPIVDQSGVVVSVYCVSAVTELARDRSLAQLDRPISEVVKSQESGENFYKCSPDDSLHMLFEKFAAVKAHRLICVDEFNHFVGIVALSDLFNYFLD